MMGRGKLNLIVVTIVCVCGVVAAWGQAPEPVEDVNEPWIAAEHLVPGWQSMALTTEYCNPEKSVWDYFPPRRTILFYGELAVTDPNGLVGLATDATDIRALDETGQPIQTVQWSSGGQPYAPLGYTTTVWVPTWERRVEIRPHTFPIEMRMEPNAPFPVTLSRLEWSMDVLLSDFFEVIDLPFAPSEDWIELVPGLNILVTEASVEDEEYRYCTEVRYDPNKIQYLHVEAYPSPPSPPVRRAGTGACETRARDLYTWSSLTPPEVIVVDIKVLDVEGNQVRQVGAGIGSEFTSIGTHRDSDGMSVTRCVVGNCSACGSAAIIRYVIAREPYEQKASFVLENVVVPTF